MAPAPITTSLRPTYLSNNSSQRRREIPSQSRTSSTLAGSSAGAWGTTVPTPEAPPVVHRSKSGSRPSLSLAQLSPTDSSFPHSGSTSTTGHPLKCDWEVYFSHRSANQNNGNSTKNKKSSNANGAEDGLSVAEKEREAKDEWSTSVVKLGGFSSIESLHPFLAHLTSPSSLPASLTPPTNVISDLNIFRRSIQPIWEDPANVNGGRFVLRLRKGVADRVWEEIVWALVGERIGAEGDEGRGEREGKVNGAVLSVRKDEDILSVWCRPSSRAERDTIRDSIRLALEPLLSPIASAALTLDFKPHPASNPLTSNPLTAASLSPSTPYPSSNHSNHRGTERNNGEHTTPRERLARNGGSGNGFYSSSPRQDRSSGHAGGEEKESNYHHRNNHLNGDSPSSNSNSYSGGRIGQRDNVDRHATPIKERSSSTAWGPN